MSIVTRFASYFIKSRVINYSLQVDRIMTEMCKAGLQDPEEGFLERDPMSYYECRFYSHIARNWTPRLESFEKEQYELARNKFVQFEDLYSFILTLHRATWEYRSLYLELTKEIATHNTWFRSEHTTLTYEHHLEEAINKYINLLDQLKEYPLWQERVKEEIGYYLHLIYNSTTHSGQSKELFAKFDKLYFFK
ncbi:unnamed protein product [Paramecium octaurelia]|uniref:Uncharacterized protein n=1 Tax=Paramecium octaurelia TaxID=43137 RepID=A0A8S1UNY7_PAROT|nr:unnamed protein product [Paramecium octaurelia]